MHVDFDGKTWSGDTRASDEGFTVVAASGNALHLIKTRIHPRQSLPELGGPGWLEGVAQRDVC